MINDLWVPIVLSRAKTLSLGTVSNNTQLLKVQEQNISHLSILPLFKLSLYLTLLYNKIQHLQLNHNSSLHLFPVTPLFFIDHYMGGHIHAR